jgi:hypothetical protein
MFSKIIGVFDVPQSITESKIVLTHAVVWALLQPIILSEFIMGIVAALLV